MNAIKRIRNFVVDTILLAMVAFIALTVYAMYTSNGAMLDTVTCHITYNNKLAENACVVAKSIQ